ncbi:MAG: 2-phosphosulfolactate phosphatase [Rhodomicrobium sp.]
MEIRIESLIEGAARAAGVVAIIDVFRAFTTAAVAFANGATRIMMVASVDEALALRDQGAGQICMGEIQGRAPERFDFGNSPYELSQADLSGKSIIQRTSAGTQGIVTAGKTAQHMFAASLVTASATVRAMRSIATDRITLVAMGENGSRRSSEDEICALYLRNLLEGRQGNPEAARQMILSGGEAGKFKDVSRPWLNPNDVPFALEIDRYDFAIKVNMENGYPVARKFDG